MPASRSVCLVAAACLACQAPLSAQKGNGKGPKPDPTAQAVSAVFATNGAGDVCDGLGLNGSGVGAINGDGGVYTSNLEIPSGAYLRPDGEFVLELDDSGPWVYLNFDAVATGPEWPTPLTPTLPPGDFCQIQLTEFHLNTHVLTAEGADDVGMGLTDMAAGSTHPSRIKSWFVLAGRTYTIRFNADHYPGSNNVVVTRGPITDQSHWNYGLGENQWVIETGNYLPNFSSGDVAQLVSPALTKKGNPGLNNEGFYHLPFKITFTLAPAP